jgi:hypothetical protein
MSLIVKQKVGYLDLIRRYVLNKISYVIFKLYERYYNNNVFSYEFKGDYLSPDVLKDAENYVNEGDAIEFYKKEMHYSDMLKLSQYYPYLKIEQDKKNNENLKIVNIGCFYAGCDNLFIERNPSCEVYGLDFGNLKKYNHNLKNINLHLLSGYPLMTLESFIEKDSNIQFDYAIFVRTAVKINIEQLHRYMRALTRISENIIFLEPAKLQSSYLPSIDVDNIDIDNPFKLYRGMYLHNYSRLLENYGYQIVEKKVLSQDNFNHSLTKDHDFVYFHGAKKI